jgi:hypothetical protein
MNVTYDSKVSYPRSYEETLDQAIAMLQRQGCVT